MSLQDTLKRAQTSAQAGRYPEAENLLKTLIVADLQNRDARLLLGTLLAKQGKLNEGISECNAILAKNPLDLETLNIAAHIYLHQGQVQDALGTFTEAAEIDSTRIDFYYHIGNLQQQLGNFKAAAMAYARTIELGDHQYIPAYNNLGIVYTALQEPSKALHILYRGLTLKPDNPILLFNYGVVLESKGQFKGAENAYRRALHYKPDWYEPMNNLGITLFKQGQYDRAVKVFTSILNREPNNCKVQNNIGVVLADQDRIEAAVQYFRQALKVDPEYKKAGNNLKRVTILKADSAATLAAGGEGLKNTLQLFDVAGMILMVDQDAESLDLPLEIPVKQSLSETDVPDIPVQDEKNLVWDFKSVEKPDMLNLLKYLVDLAEYLPSGAQEKFIQSDAQSGLRYIIATLEKT